MDEDPLSLTTIDAGVLWSAVLEELRPRVAALDISSTEFDAFVSDHGPKLRGALIGALYPPTQPAASASLPAADLCSGVGMLALAFQLEGFDMRALCEFDEDRQLVAWYNLTRAHDTVRAELLAAGRTLPDRMEDVEIVAGGGDARTWRPPVPVGGLAVLTGGPPCQPFSRRGAEKGEHDERDLFMDVAAICEECQPTVIVMENVEGTENDKHADYFRRWWERMDAAGYEGVKWILRAADYGSCQLRLRAFFVAWRKGFPGADALRTAPPPTHYSPAKDQRPPTVSPMVHTQMAERARATATKRWVSAIDRANGGCCYGMWACNWINNVGGRCEDCFRGSNYLPSTHALDVAFPPGPDVACHRDNDGVYYAHVTHSRVGGVLVQVLPATVEVKKGSRRTHKSIGRQVEGYRRVPQSSWWRLADSETDEGLVGRAVLVEAPPATVEAVPGAKMPKTALESLLMARWSVEATGGLKLKVLPERTVARRRLHFRRQPKQLKYAKVLDRAGRMPRQHASYLTPAMLAGSHRSMAGTIYTTTDSGEDGIDSLRAATVLEHMTAMGLPVWFAPGVEEADVGNIFTAMGNGVPVELGRAFARHVWAAFGREALPLPKQAGLWSLEGAYIAPGEADYSWCGLAETVRYDEYGPGWRASRWFEPGQEDDYGEEDPDNDDWL